MCNIGQIEKVYTLDDDENKLTIIKFQEYGVESESVTLKFIPRHALALMFVSDLTLKACFRPGKESSNPRIVQLPYVLTTLCYFYREGSLFLRSYNFVIPWQLPTFLWSLFAKTTIVGYS